MKYCHCDGVLSVRVSTSDFIVMQRKLIIVLSVCQRWAWQKELNNYIEGTCLKVHQIAFRWTSFIPTNSLLGVVSGMRCEMTYTKRIASLIVVRPDQMLVIHAV